MKRESIQIPEDIMTDLRELSAQLGYTYRREAAVVPLLDALSKLEPETLEQILEDEKLSPRHIGRSVYK